MLGLPPISWPSFRPVHLPAAMSTLLQKGGWGRGPRPNIAWGLCLCRGGADLFHALCLQTILRGEQRGGGGEGERGEVKKCPTLAKREKVIRIINLSTKP